ncbi:hypothetical protein QU481_21155 [Crenobacter sp. SG2303]|uniref:Uncharacterized protein n=2 Tax=Crenobacter oryzisoli TaxID=3056844 RepID=A0ABT7XU58_9NEIS|nr:hypothetical protein [Crenobacter sp. SG2303]MDN0077343.1 hypothetical protein [Crenobacter sp. SG2303]
MDPMVPNHYQGVWQRRILQRGTEHCDTDTRVFWLQTRNWHGDIRIPADRSSFHGIKSVAECSLEQLQWLCLQEGFVGTTWSKGDIVGWDRQVDFRFRDTPDFGRMKFQGDVLEEFGIASDYYERWERIPKSLGATFALEQLTHACEGPTYPRRYLLVAGEYFILLRDRTLLPAPACRIRRKIESGTASREEYEAWVDLEVSFGCRENDTWRITLSTLPWREGEAIWCQGDLSEPCLDIVTQAGPMSNSWRVLDWSYA